MNKILQKHANDLEKIRGQQGEQREKQKEDLQVGTDDHVKLMHHNSFLNKIHS